MCTHIYRCTLLNDAIKIEEEMKGALRHLERGKRDCYKALIIAYKDKYHLFNKSYAKVDLHLLDSGKFRVKVDKYYEDLVLNEIEAKKFETGSSKSESREVCNKYRKCYNLAKKNE